MVFRLMESAFASEKIESRHFTPSLSLGKTFPGSYHHLPKAKGNYSFSLNSVFSNLDPSEESGDYGQALLGYEEVFVDGSDGSEKLFERYSLVFH